MSNVVLFVHTPVAHIVISYVALKAIIFTHIVGFERARRTAVVGQELCNRLSQAEREMLLRLVNVLLHHESRTNVLPYKKHRSLLISYNLCPFQSEYCNKDGSM